MVPTRLTQGSSVGGTGRQVLGAGGGFSVQVFLTPLEHFKAGEGAFCGRCAGPVTNTCGQLSWAEAFGSLARYNNLQ